MSRRFLLIVLALGVLAACGSRPYRVSLRAPARVTPTTVELDARCRVVRNVSECVGVKWCTTRRVEEPAACPDGELEVDARGGRTAAAPMSPDGKVVVAITGTAERPIDAEELSIKHVHSYRSAMLTTDLVIVGGSGLVLWLGMELGSPDLAMGGAAIGGVAYHLAAPIVHASHGNRRGAGLSLLRRLLFTAGAVAWLMADVGCGDDVGECSADREAVSALAWILPLPLNVLIDAAVAKLELDVPVDAAISSSRDGAVVGIGGRF